MSNYSSSTCAQVKVANGNSSGTPQGVSISSFDSRSSICSTASSIFSSTSSTSTATSGTTIDVSLTARRRGVNIVALDGGGIKAVSSTRMMQDVRAQIISLGLPQETKLRDVIDHFVGVSGGGFEAALLWMGASEQRILEIFKDLAASVFASPLLAQIWRLYRTRGRFPQGKLVKALKKVVKELTGEENTLLADESNKCVLTIVAADGDRLNKPRPIIFSSHSCAARPASQIPLWQVLLASAAAPTYFPAVTINGKIHIDGGAGFNNPAELAVRETRRLFPGQEINSIISLGCGEVRDMTCRGLVKLVLAIGDFVTDTRGVHNRMIEAWGETGKYHRLEVGGCLGSDVGLEEWKKVGLVLKATEKWLTRLDVNDEVREIARQIVTNERCYGL